jgi:hypothetical protein
MRRDHFVCSRDSSETCRSIKGMPLGDDQHDNALTFGSHYVRGLYATTSSDRHLLHQEVMPLWWMSPYGTFAACGRKRASASIQKAVVSSSEPHTL